MAKRKAAGGTRKAARTSARAGSRTSGRKTASTSANTAGRKATRASARATRSTRPAGKAKKAATPRVGPKRAAPRKSAGSKKAVARKKVTTAKKRAVQRARVTTPRSAPPARARRATPARPTRKAASLERERRSVADEDEMVPTPPSTLDLDRSASAVRSGRRGMQQRFAEHNETSPAITAGDIDANWEAAYSVGDEAPGGDNMTPDQDIVDEIGRAVGVEYQDNEELKGEEKIARRDAHRWELDPASAEDWDDRD